MESRALPRIYKVAVQGLLGIGVCMVLCLFFEATTFLGDDYLFRTYGRFEPYPWLAFIQDKHGGEYYRPMPMLVWWVLERISGGHSFVFALTALVLHTACTWFLARLAGHLGGDQTTQKLTAALFFLSPAQVEAALWFSASTDLLCTFCILACMCQTLVSSRFATLGACCWAGLALFSKETAIVLPALVFAGFCLSNQPIPWRRAAQKSIPFLLITLAYVGLRFSILGGVGGTNDPKAAILVRGFQVMAGLCHAVVGYGPWPHALVLIFGALALIWVAWTMRQQGNLAAFAWVFVLSSIVLLPFAGWVVGARYFYFSAAGLALLFGAALARRPRWLLGFVLVGLTTQNLLLAHTRIGEIRRYKQTVAVAKIAVVDTLKAKDTRVFIFRGAVKDLDLAIKLDDRLPLAVQHIIVIPDVPSSFVRVPSDLTDTVGFLLSSRPLPPSGAYQWGTLRVVGLAGREEAPDLEEVLKRLPGLAFLHLEKSPHGGISWQDRTNQLHQP